MNNPKIIAMIPARIGSERLKYKNLRILNGKPVIAFAIEAAEKAGIFDQIVVNSDGAGLGEIAQRYGIDFYHRSTELADSQARSDDVVADFMGRFDGDLLVWVNPIAPLQPGHEIREAVEYFIENNLDSLITVKNEQVHGLYDGVPINFSEKELFAKTQDLKPIQTMVYSVMMWRYKTFLSHYQQHGFALLSGKVGYFPVGKDSTIILKHEEDLRVVEAILHSRAEGLNAREYDPIVENIKG
jgi:CMP-N-acetylneuraminic acid synthetase